MGCAAAWRTPCFLAQTFLGNGGGFRGGESVLGEHMTTVSVPVLSLLPVDARTRETPTSGSI